MKIILKELKETRVCLKLILRKEMIKPIKKLEPLGKENEELIAITSTSIETAKKNNQKEKQKRKLISIYQIIEYSLFFIEC